MNEAVSARRRHFLKAAAVGGAGLCLPGFTPLLAQSAAPSLQWQALDDDVALIRGGGGNILVSRGSDGILMVDGGHARAAAEILALVENHFGGRPSVLFNSHCHREQIGCNEALQADGATIIAHENTRLWLSTEIISKWEDKVYPPLSASAWPNKTFYDGSEQLHFNEPVEYGYLPQAHTDGDIYIRFPERNLLFAGDVVAPEAYPVLDYSTNGWLGGMIDALTQLLALSDEQTRIVASSGAIVDRAFLAAQRDMCQSVIEQMGDYFYEGRMLQEFLDSQPSAEFDARWGEPEHFLSQAWKGTIPRVTEVRRYRRR